MIQAQATARYVRTSAQKAGLVLALTPGKDVNQALATLKFTPKAIAEAMLSGVPIITHRSRFNNEHLNFLKPEFAKWCEPDDVEAYYKNMEWFVENKNQIREVGQKARRAALELFSPEKIMPHVLQSFKDAAKTNYYYTFKNQIRGRLILWWNNLKMLPFYLAKLAAYKIPAFRKAAEKAYKSRPLY